MRNVSLSVMWSAIIFWIHQHSPHLFSYILTTNTDFIHYCKILKKILDWLSLCVWCDQMVKTPILVPLSIFIDKHAFWGQSICGNRVASLTRIRLIGSKGSVDMKNPLRISLFAECIQQKCVGVSIQLTKFLLLRSHYCCNES